MRKGAVDAVIEIRNASLGYGSRCVLSQVSCCFEPGKVHILIGLNGSGKSTLLKSAAGQIPLLSGALFWNDMHPGRLKAVERAGICSYLPQKTSGISLDVLAYVMHGCFASLSWPRHYGSREKQKALEALQVMKIDHLAACPMDTLSGGQQQKAACAQALCQNAETLLLDEPTASLDLSSRYEIMDHLKAMAEQGKCIVIVMHDLPMAMEYADRLWVIADGRIAWNGTPEEFDQMNLCPRYFETNLLEMRDGEKRIWALSKLEENNEKSSNPLI